MRSSSELCHGRRQRGYSLETKSVLPLWLRPGRFRKFALVTSPIFVITNSDISSASWDGFQVLLPWFSLVSSSG